MCHGDWDAPVDARAGAAEISIPVQPGDAVDGAATAMPGWRFDPPGRSRGTCLLAPDIYGVNAFYSEIAARLAAAGFTTVLVEYFFREGPLTAPTREAALDRREPMDEARALRDLNAALDTLTAPGTRVGLVGFCLSGQFALDLCASRDDLAAVCFYPFPEGVAVGPVAVAAPRPVDLADQITGPILSFWGKDDYIAHDVIDRFAAAMRAHRVDYTQHLYDRAGHAFLQGLVEEREDSPAARDAWARTLAFLTEHVASNSSRAESGDGPDLPADTGQRTS